MYEVRFDAILGCICHCEDEDALCDLLEIYTGLYAVGLAAAEWASTALPGDKWKDAENGVSVRWPPLLCGED